MLTHINAFIRSVRYVNEVIFLSEIILFTKEPYNSYPLNHPTVIINIEGHHLVNSTSYKHGLD